jgi:hypothetical protein
MDYSRLKTRLENNEIKDKEEKEEILKMFEKESKINSAKFTELFNSRNKSNEILTELATTIKLMMKNIDIQFENLDKKIDELKQR